jgi:hypothetical protein
MAVSGKYPWLQPITKDVLLSRFTITHTLFASRSLNAGVRHRCALSHPTLMGQRSSHHLRYLKIATSTLCATVSPSDLLPKISRLSRIMQLIDF